MEAKRPWVAIIATLCVLLLLVALPGQAAAMSEFCKCYRECYSRCRHRNVPRWVCLPFCSNNCVNDVVDGASRCRMACKVSVCGWPATPHDTDDAGICTRNCDRKWSHHKAN